MRLLHLLLLAASACAPSRTPSLAPVRGGEPGIPAAHWPAIYFWRFDDVVAAAGLRPLRAGPATAREVRIWVGGGLGYPQVLYRIVEQGGQTFGEQVLYWPTDPLPAHLREPPGKTFHDLMLHTQRGRCAGFRRGRTTAICRTRFTRPPDWGAVLRRAEAAGLWILPDASTLPSPRLVFDGWTLTVELRDGAAYRTYHYSNPDRQSWPEARQAEAIAEAMTAIDSLARLPDVIRTYRGVTTGRYKSAFQPCGEDTAWEFQGDLVGLARAAGEATALDTADASRHYYVELLGELAPGWLVRQWESPYAEVLQPHTVQRIAPWTGVECRQAGAPGEGPA